jgi:hypothetical protein
VNGFYGHFVLIDKSLLVHKAGGVGKNDIHSPGFGCPVNFVFSHALILDILLRISILKAAR